MAEQRQFSSLDQEAVQLCYFPEDIMFIRSGFQVIFTGAAACANAGADHPVHHIHVAIPPAAQLFINFQQHIQQLKRQL